MSSDTSLVRQTGDICDPTHRLAWARVMTITLMDIYLIYQNKQLN